jgi:hypothetical protein
MVAAVADCEVAEAELAEPFPDAPAPPKRNGLEAGAVVPPRATQAMAQPMTKSRWRLGLGGIRLHPQVGDIGVEKTVNHTPPKYKFHDE